MKTMAQDIMFPYLVYFLLFIVQNASTSVAPIRETLKKEEISLNECPNCDEYEKKIKRELDIAFSKSRYIKNFPDSFYKYKYQKTPSKYNYLLLKGWGARGMPFNVLYTPNIYQQKVMKFVPQTAKLMVEPVKEIPQIYNLVLEKEKPTQRVIGNMLKKQPKPRKYYSLIPQLFVSYGW